MAQRGQVIENRTLGQRIVFRETAAETGGEVLGMEATQAPGKGVPPHLHPEQEERTDVVEGEIDLLVGLRRRRLAAGEGATVPAKTVHGFRALGPAT